MIKLFPKMYGFFYKKRKLIILIAIFLIVLIFAFIKDSSLNENYRSKNSILSSKSFEKDVNIDIEISNDKIEVQEISISEDSSLDQISFIELFLEENNIRYSFDKFNGINLNDNRYVLYNDREELYDTTTEKLIYSEYEIKNHNIQYNDRYLFGKLLSYDKFDAENWDGKISCSGLKKTYNEKKKNTQNETKSQKHYDPQIKKISDVFSKLDEFLEVINQENILNPRDVRTGNENEVFKIKDEFINTKNEIKKYIESIFIPDTIKNEVNNGVFKYRLQPIKVSDCLVNKGTLSKIRKKLKNKFLIELFEKITVIKKEEIRFDPKDKNIKKALDIKIRHKKDKFNLIKNSDYRFRNRNMENKIRFVGKKLRNDYEFLYFENTDHNLKNLKQKLKTLKNLTNYEKYICKRFEFVVCNEIIESILDFFNNKGILIPDILIDPVSSNMIDKPILLSSETGCIVDIKTYVMYDNMKTEQEILRSYLHGNLNKKKRNTICNAKKIEIEKIRAVKKLFYELIAPYRKFFETYCKDDNLISLI